MVAINIIIAIVLLWEAKYFKGLPTWMRIMCVVAGALNIVVAVWRILS